MNSEMAYQSSAAPLARARRMAADGHGLHDIASILRVHPEQVRRWLDLQAEPFTLKPGEMRFDASGKEIASLPEEAKADMENAS